MRDGAGSLRLVAVVCLAGCPVESLTETGRFSEGEPPPSIEAEPGPFGVDEGLCDEQGSAVCDVLQAGEAPTESWESYCERLESGYEPACGDCSGWNECADLGEAPSEDEWASDGEEEPYGDGDADGDADGEWDEWGDGDADGDADGEWDEWGDGDADADEWDDGAGDADADADDPWDESTWSDQDCDDWYGGGGWCAECWACCWSFDCTPEGE